MLRTFVAVLILGIPAGAAEPLRFKWKAGEQYAYSVSHSTAINETAPLVEGGMPETTTRNTKLTLSKRWNVKEVDVSGTATIELTITSMKQEIVRSVIDPSGKLANETIVLDSTTADGAKEMAAFLNKPILTAKVDSRGGVIEAKSSNGDSAANRLQAELPFRIILPEMAIEPNGKWERTFSVKLDPPLGAGELYEAKQNCSLRAIKDGYAVIGTTTEFKNPPTAAADLQPLLPWLWEGDVFVQVDTGRYAGAKLKAGKTITNHQGAGTKFVFASEYTEAVAGK